MNLDYQIRKFEVYFNQFYGKDGIYPSGRHIGFVELTDAVAKLDNFGGGDSVDRENVRDIIFTNEEQDEMYGATTHG